MTIHQTRNMKRIILLLCLHLLTAIILPAQPLAQRLEKLLNDPLLYTSEVGITVHDLTVGQPVFAYQDKKLYRPASIAKLLTGITALDKLGANHTFTTSVYYHGEVADSVLHGNLYVVGGFDSEFGEPEMEQLVNGVKRLGIKRIAGRLLGDVSLTDSLYYGDGWSWNDAVYEFQPCLSPLMFCKGAVSVTAIPAATDTVATLTATPVSTYYTLQNNTRCRRPEAGKFRVDRNWLQQGNALTATGNISTRSTKIISLFNSQNFFMHTFSERLQQQGITVDSTYCFAELPTPKDITSNTPAAKDTTSITESSNKWLTDSSSFVRPVKIVSASHTLSEILTRAMKKSDNLSAEAMLRHLALAGEKQKHIGASDGVEIIGDMMEQLGYNPKDYCLVDGSGVSLYNYISPDLLLAFLKYAYAHPDLYSTLKESLPVAGIDGTLSHRMKGKSAYRKVFAKTGTLTGISSLAGFAHTPDNHVLAFVIINQNVLKSRNARAFQDKVCTELCK